MSRCSRPLLFVGLSIVWCCVSASAETLSCQSVNGNLNCAGSSGVSCQTVNGKTVCTSGHGDIVQTFGNDRSINTSGDDATLDPNVEQRLEKHDASGHRLLLDREGRKLHLQNGWLSFDRE